MRCGRMSPEGRLEEIFAPRAELAAMYHPEFVDRLIDIPDHVQAGWWLSGSEWLAALPPPAPSADDVRAEASRRMQALVGARDASHLDIILANGTREAVRLLRIRETRPWTGDEAARAAALEQIDAAIEAIRAASNTMEHAPPADFASSSYWPSTS
ncbi:MAG: hypothetical protein AB7O57_15170 [Hyphomicrobiaceae bacterium]